MEKGDSIWTIDALKKHFDSIIYRMDIAIQKADEATGKRFEGVNEFRAQLSDQARMFMPRIELEVMVKNLNEKINILDDKIDELENKIEKFKNMKAGGNAMIAYIIAGISILIAIVTFILKIR